MANNSASIRITATACGSLVFVLSRMQFNSSPAVGFQNMVASNTAVLTSKVSILNSHVRRASVCHTCAKGAKITSQRKTDTSQVQLPSTNSQIKILPMSKYSHFTKFNACQFFRYTVTYTDLPK